MLVDSIFDGTPQVFRLLVHPVVCGKVSEENGQKEEISFALPLPIEIMHWMRREAGMRPIVPFTPPGYCDAFTFNLAFYCRISGIMEEADIHFRRNLAQSITFPGQGSYAGTPTSTILEHLESLGRVTTCVPSGSFPITDEFNNLLSEQSLHESIQGDPLKETLIKELLKSYDLTGAQKRLLNAIALEPTPHIYSKRYMQIHKLTRGGIGSALRRLVEMKLVEKENGVWQVL